MKTQILKFSMLALVLSIGFAACEQADLLPTDEQLSSEVGLAPSVEPTEEAEALIEMEFEQKLVATLQKDGHEVQFHSYGDPASNLMFTAEKLYGRAAENDEPYLNSSELNYTPYDIFIMLTDANVPVPQEIALSSNNRAAIADGRSIMLYDETLELLDENYTDLEVRNCSNDDMGASNFRQQICDNQSSPGNITFCDYYANTSNFWRGSKYAGTWYKIKNGNFYTNVICGEVRHKVFHWIRSQSDPTVKWRQVGQYDAVSGKHNVNFNSLFNQPQYTYVSRTRMYGNHYYRTHSRFKQ